jgi:hypothetical protein
MATSAQPRQPQPDPPWTSADASPRTARCPEPEHFGWNLGDGFTSLQVSSRRLALSAGQICAAEKQQ